MGEIIVLVICVIAIIVLKIIFKINLKEAKKIEDNKDLQKITNKFPENKEIAKEMLDILENSNVTIEEQKNTKTSLYIAVTNKILIADLKENYARIQTIAHECLHSVQDRTLLLFNFVFSNITIIYFYIAIILTICKIYKNIFLQIVIILIMGLIGFAVRAFLEIDAMTKSKFLAKEYIERKKICTAEEESSLLNEYEKINNMGIKYYLYNLISNILIKVIILISVFLVISNI